MAGGEPSDIPKLTGLSKYFNSYTTSGRANSTLATWGAIALAILYYKLKPSKQSDSKK